MIGRYIFIYSVLIKTLIKTNNVLGERDENFADGWKVSITEPRRITHKLGILGVENGPVQAVVVPQRPLHWTNKTRAFKECGLVERVSMQHLEHDCYRRRLGEMYGDSTSQRCALMYRKKCYWRLKHPERYALYTIQENDSLQPLKCLTWITITWCNYDLYDSETEILAPLRGNVALDILHRYLQPMFLKIRTRLPGEEVTSDDLRRNDFFEVFHKDKLLHEEWVVIPVRSEVFFHPKLIWNPFGPKWLRLASQIDFVSINLPFKLRASINWKRN